MVARNYGFDREFRNGRGCVCASELVNDSLPLRTEADRFNTKSRDYFRFGKRRLAVQRPRRPRKEREERFKPPPFDSL